MKFFLVSILSFMLGLTFSISIELVKLENKIDILDDKTTILEKKIGI